MSVNVQYMGFESQGLVREYSFVVREGSSETREFTLAIVNEAFSSHRVRYQDAPDICSAKLHRELAAFANHPPLTHFKISEAELDEYRDSHATKASSGFHRPRATKEL